MTIANNEGFSAFILEDYLKVFPEAEAVPEIPENLSNFFNDYELPNLTGEDELETVIKTVELDTQDSLEKAIKALYLFRERLGLEPVEATEPADVNVDEPVEEPAEEPAEEPTEPVDETVEDPAEEPSEEPVEPQPVDPNQRRFLQDEDSEEADDDDDEEDEEDDDDDDVPLYGECTATAK